MPGPRLCRVLRRLARYALILCIPLWLIGHFWSASISFRSAATLNTVSLRMGYGIGCGSGTGNAQFRLLGASGITGTLTICDRDAAVLAHQSFNAGPFDPTGLRLPNIYIPFWILILSLAAAVFLIRLRERRIATLANLCPRCEYNLAGLPPDSPCPECGCASASLRPSSINRP